MLNQINYSELLGLETMVFQSGFELEAADDEPLKIAEFIQQKTQHNEYINPKRINFQFSEKLIKEGGRYVLGTLKKRDPEEIIINGEFDFIVKISYKIWKELDIENKVIQLDKILSGIDIGTSETPKMAKKQYDSKEFIENLKFFGIEKVINSSEVVHLACERIIEKEKENKKNGGFVDPGDGNE